MRNHENASNSPTTDVGENICKYLESIEF